MKHYRFESSLARGEAWEKVLDGFFEQWYRIKPVSARDQARGIDRIFWHGNRRFAVEYKADEIASTTGNAFVELEAVGGRGGYKPGWARRNASDILIYYIPQWGTIYVIEPRRLPPYANGWKRRYENVKVHNVGYTGLGVLVPLDEFERVTIKKLEGPVFQALPNQEGDT